MKNIAFALILTIIASCTGTQPEVNIIPKPVSITVGNRYTTAGADRVNRAEPDAAMPPEAYNITVDGNGITVKAADDAGYFYALQTLEQLQTDRGIPHVEIADQPRFPYRGLMLDVSRHFFPKEFVLKLLDEMSHYKLNRLHLHLTDGGGWRVQIDKYPELTRLASYRTDAEWGGGYGRANRFLPEGTEGAYGGYYTKDDIREIVAHAAQRHITVIPEIEMPGHSSEVFAAYPELCCAGEAYQGGDFCIGNPKTIPFLQDVITEIIELFPSEYIHVGGDEASKRHWRTCPKCQRLMREQNLKNVDELQSYLIHRMDEFIHSRGRKLLGWDEILEGGLAPEATVMSWRSTEGGIEAARMGHDVVMTPVSHLYFDYYQADPNTQPPAIGGYVSPRRVYSFNPVPVDSLSPEQHKHILGVQANLWTEFVPDEKHAEYMLFPRALALAEVAWTPQEQRSWLDFKPRMNAHIAGLHSRGVNAFALSDEIDISTTVDTINRNIQVTLDAEKYPAEIRYTTDGSTPTASSTLYDGRPITVTDSVNIAAAIFRNGTAQKTYYGKADYHRGINKPIRYNSTYSPRYTAGGNNALLNGYRGSITYLDGLWQGCENTLDCVIDMGEITDIHEVSARFMQLIGPQVFQPGSVELLTSDDGVTFTPQGTVPTTIANNDPKLSFQEYAFYGNWKARYIQLKANETNGGNFIFTDEIVIW